MNNGIHYFSMLSIGRRQAFYRNATSKQDIFLNSTREMRTIRFKIPREEQLHQIEIPSSDRSTTWEVVKTLLPHEQKSIEPANEHEAHVLKVFGNPNDELLTVPPLKYLPSPFKYHSAVNGDISYVTQPRLSVSKLLTDAWCELRSFYDIYAGLPQLPPLSSMKVGIKYHAKLESEEHPKRDKLSLKGEIKALLAKHPKNIRDELVRTKDAYGFAQNWVEQTVFRSICAGHTKVARELFVHGFMDFKLGNLVTDADKLKNGVLVNGIADIVKIDTYNATEFTDDAALGELSDEDSSGSLSDHIPKFGLSEVLDLNVELATAKSTMSQLAKDHFLHTRDVKTRRLNVIPSQALAIKGAKLQCMYYAVFLYNLARSAEFAYESCIENLTRRRIDPDEPISIALATELLVVNFRTIALDCVRLAKGEPIGFSKFDNHTHPANDYSLSQFLTETQFRSLIEIHYKDELDISGFDLSSLFTNWKVPLTLRYISARTGQAFNIYEAFEPSSVCIEYHNPLKHQLIARMHYPFDMQEIQDSITQSSKFWSGERRPSHTKDPSMCNYCNFKKRCSAINSEIGPEAAKLIHELQI